MASGGFPGASEAKNPSVSEGDMGSTPGPRRFHVLRGSQVRAAQLLSLYSRAHEAKKINKINKTIKKKGRKQSHVPSS